MGTLIVHLPPQAATPSTEYPWATTADGSTLASHGSAPASLLPRPSGTGAEVAAVVPAARLSWHQVVLPKGLAPGSPRLRSALEGLLEDRLLDETDALHFALEAGASSGQPCWVAVCERAWLRQQLQALEAAQRPVSRIVPEFAPGKDSSLHALGPAEEASLLHASSAGVARVPLVAAAIALLPADAASGDVTAEPGVAALAEQLLGTKVLIEQAPTRWLRALGSGWDLAQFEFATSGRSRALRRFGSGLSALLRAPAWRPARWGAALLVGVNLLCLNAWAWKERSALQDKREAIRAALTQTFPNVRVVVDAPLQMKREVASLRQATGASSNQDLESMLTALAAVLPTDRSLAAIEYQGGELRVRGPLVSANDVASHAAAMQALGYSLRAEGNALVVRAEGTR